MPVRGSENPQGLRVTKKKGKNMLDVITRIAEAVIEELQKD